MAWNFRDILKHFWISWHFNFAIRPKYYISWHFIFANWPKYYNLRHFSFVVLFFMCVSFQHFRNFWINMEPKCKLKVHFYLFLHTTHPQNIKNTRQTSSLVKDRHLHLSLQLDLQIPRLDNLPPACQEALHNKIVIGYNKIMKSNNFRHCVTMGTVKFLFCVLWSSLLSICFNVAEEKNGIRKDVSIVYSNNESEDPAKERPG